jgi:hypothetical protein
MHFATVSNVIQVGGTVIIGVVVAGFLWNEHRHDPARGIVPQREVAVSKTYEWAHGYIRRYEKTKGARGGANLELYNLAQAIVADEA